VELLLGFKEVKERAIECIKNGHVRHVARDLDKNMFAAGYFTPKEIVQIIGSCRGDCYQTDRHHLLQTEVHILKPRGKHDGLYIKFFFVEPDILFISVHQSDYRG
jgi:hypothetical protein